MVRKFDDTIDGSELELIADDEIFAIAKTDETTYHGYLISNYGRVYSRITKKFIKGKIDLHGYMTYTLNSGSPIGGHRLVGFSFVDGYDAKTANVVNHKDDKFENRSNNYYKNLEWCDNDYNLQYNDAHLRRVPFVGKKVSQSDENGNVIAIYESMSAAARKMGVNMSSVRGWCGKKKMYRGFYWDFVA